MEGGPGEFLSDFADVWVAECRGIVPDVLEGESAEGVWGERG